MLKLIHPKTGTVREVNELHQNKIRILKRGGFIDFDKYKPTKKQKAKPEPTLADLVEKNKNEEGEVVKDNEPEVAIHVSASARALIEENDLDASLIEGTGKKGQIIKPDVIAHLEALAVSNEELPEEAPGAEEILTHDNTPVPSEEPVEAVLEGQEEAE